MGFESRMHYSNNLDCGCVRSAETEYSGPINRRNYRGKILLGHMLWRWYVVRCFYFSYLLN